MNNVTKETKINGRKEGIVRYFSGETTYLETASSVTEQYLIPQYSLTKEGIYEERPRLYKSIPLTGGVEKETAFIPKRTAELLKSAINLLDEVLEVYNDEVERLNTFSLFEEKLKDLWNYQEETNQYFQDVLILLEVAAKNAHYENYEKNQYEAIKMTLQKIRKISVTTSDVDECRKTLIDNGIDLLAPIRNWQDYTIEIKKNVRTE